MARKGAVAGAKLRGFQNLRPSSASGREGGRRKLSRAEVPERSKPSGFLDGAEHAGVFAALAERPRKQSCVSGT